MSKKVFVSDFDETYGLGISNIEFHQNRKQKFFLTSKTRVFDVFKLKLGNFQITLRAKGGPGPYSRCQNFIKLGPKIDFDLVSDGPMSQNFWLGQWPK